MQYEEQNRSGKTTLQDTLSSLFEKSYQITGRNRFQCPAQEMTACVKTDATLSIIAKEITAYHKNK